MRTVDAQHHLWDLSVRDQDRITGAAPAALRRGFPLNTRTGRAKEAGVGSSDYLCRLGALPDNALKISGMATEPDRQHFSSAIRALSRRPPSTSSPRPTTPPPHPGEDEYMAVFSGAATRIYGL